MKMLLSKCRLFIISLTFCYLLDSVFVNAGKKANSERSDECIDITMVCDFVFVPFSKNSRKTKISDGKTGIFTQNQFLTKSIFCIWLYLKFLPNVYIVKKKKNLKSFITIFFIIILYNKHRKHRRNFFLLAFAVQILTKIRIIHKNCCIKLKFWCIQAIKHINHFFHQPLEIILSYANKSSSFRIVFCIQ
ncbi:hypothetical protein AGLY_013828 [Aphis glycines]|uniref:Uncharacterized protein n=1 Tax=Aphis glycines TaxID=307491 RepID=A0A6G0T5D4_APHGL|nr:hypothetical protein AGLY_013828 [Aphis glycines]